MHRSATPSLATSTGPSGAGTASRRTATASSTSPRSRSRSRGAGPTCSSTPSTPAGCRRGWAARGAPDDLELGHVTQAWLAVSDDPDAIDQWRLLAPPAPPAPRRRRRATGVPGRAARRAPAGSPTSLCPDANEPLPKRPRQLSSRSSQSTFVHMRWKSGPYHGRVHLQSAVLVHVVVLVGRALRPGGAGACSASTSSASL